MDLHVASLERREAELNEFDSELKTLELKAQVLRPAHEVSLYGDLQELRTRFADMRRQFGELRDSGSKEWDEREEKLEATWKEFQSGLKRIQRQIE